MEPSIGDTTVQFQILAVKDSLACRIFLDAQSLNDGLAMISDPSATCVSATGMLVLTATKSLHSDRLC